jgi:hypothetical protein
MSASKPQVHPHPYSGRVIVLTTKHEKLSLMAPILEAELDLKVVLHEGDTDQYGAFTGEIERTLSPREAAIAKAKLGMIALGARLGIASEGSIGPDPMMPFSRSDIEYIALVDLDRDLEIVERYRSLRITAGETVTEPGFDISSFLAKVDFPKHKLIAKPNDAEDAKSIKGIGTVSDLEKAIYDLSAQSRDGQVLLQSDLRAHCSPSRQQNIIQATQLLARRVKALCPSCENPGFGETKYERGLDCYECGEWVSTAPKYLISACVKCSFEKRGEQLAMRADPSNCNGCNP